MFNAPLLGGSGLGSLRLEVFLPDGDIDSRADRRLALRFLQRLAGRIVAAAALRLQDGAGVGEGAIAAREGALGPFRYVVKERLRRGAIEIAWYAGDRRRLWRQVVPVISEVELSPGSMWGRARIVGGWFLLLIAGEGFVASEPGKHAIEASRQAYNAVYEAARDAPAFAETVADELNVTVTVEVKDDVVTVTIRRNETRDPPNSRSSAPR